jgi:hypothetical protein
MRLQSSFEKRDSLKREISYEREVFCAFWLVLQAKRATFSGTILLAEALRFSPSAHLSLIVFFLGYLYGTFAGFHPCGGGQS